MVLRKAKADCKARDIQFLTYRSLQHGLFEYEHDLFVKLDISNPLFRLKTRFEPG